MKTRELMNLGLPKGPLMQLAFEGCAAAHKAGLTKSQVRSKVKAVLRAPELHVDDAAFGELAQGLIDAAQGPAVMDLPEEGAPWRQWGEGLDENAVAQMRNACRLPVSARGALMPDAHVGYGLPIGGVLGVRNAVIPYAVGVDIACRMRISIYDAPPLLIKAETDRLINIIEEETRFGVGAEFKKNRNEHAVLDEDWSISQITRTNKKKAHAQLGTSGSGNHFVEFGTLTLSEPELGLQAGEYLALLSHSGSRGIGAMVAQHYSRLAMQQHPDLPKELRHLAWLSLDSQPGQEYWRAMQLMGKYAAANHAIIHQRIARALGAQVIADVENHHNFAWEEEHFGEKLIVHRKGATPAHGGVLGIVPGSMASPAYIVRGKGEAESLRSASHGAGRVMSRTAAKRSITWSAVKKLLADREVLLLSAGLDEAPMVYKDIHDVMDAQQDLVDTVARFDPKIVKMAPAGEKPED
jgi:tRNA-splicing ligase RtcB